MNFKVYLGQKILCNTKLVKGIGAQIGLMFQPNLKKRDTLMLVLPNAKVDIHTWFVFFPIDLFFLDEKFRVIEKASMEPWKIYMPKKKANYLLEANKGELSLKLNDRLIIEK